MMDLKDKIRKELETMQLAGLATVTEEGLPWTRYVMISGDDELTVRCATFLEARKVSQIQANPEVHINCGVNESTSIKPYLQIQGVATVTTDRDERHAFWNPTLHQIFDGPDDPHYAVLVVRPYRIEYWCMGSMLPEVLELRTQI